MSKSSNLTPNAWHLARSTTEPGTQVLSERLFSVKGWVAVVTGGGTGLGLLAAVALAQNGAKVYVTGRRKDVLEEAASTFKPTGGSGEIIALEGDLSTKEGVLAFSDAVASREEFVNLLINSHGISGNVMRFNDTDVSPEALKRMAFETDSVESWKDTYCTNVISYHFNIFAFLPLLAAAATKGEFPESGNVINVGSNAVLQRKNAMISYACSKAAVHKLSTILSNEFALRGLGIRVNTIAPGSFPTGINNVDPDGDIEAARKSYGLPLWRPGQADDYAGALLSLATNRYTTGCEFLVDGSAFISMSEVKKCSR